MNLEELSQLVKRPVNTEAIKEKIREEALLKGDFTLRSKRKSNYYIDKYLFLTNPEVLADLGHALAYKIVGLQNIGIRVDRIAGAELGGIPLISTTSILSGKPTVLIRNQKKNYGTAKQIEGNIKAGEQIVILEDIATTGGQVLEAAKLLENEFEVKIVQIIAIVDRQEGARENIESAGYTFDAIFTQDDILDASKSVDAPRTEAEKNFERDIPEEDRDEVCEWISEAVTKNNSTEHVRWMHIQRLDACNMRGHAILTYKGNEYSFIVQEGNFNGQEIESWEDGKTYEPYEIKPKIWYPSCIYFFSHLVKSEDQYVQEFDRLDKKHQKYFIDHIKAMYQSLEWFEENRKQLQELTRDYVYDQFMKPGEFISKAYQRKLNQLFTATRAERLCLMNIDQVDEDISVCIDFLNKHIEFLQKHGNFMPKDSNFLSKNNNM